MKSNQQTLIEFLDRSEFEALNLDDKASYINQVTYLKKQIDELNDMIRELMIGQVLESNSLVSETEHYKIRISEYNYPIIDRDQMKEDGIFDKYCNYKPTQRLLIRNKK